MINFETVIGIEIHLELNTKTKMFSSAPNDFHSEPNTNVSEVDLGYPGTLPVLNKEAVISGIKLGKALNMTIDEVLKFDRKNYYYPDLPKGYQITQDKNPIGSRGSLKIFDKEIAIERIHLEEDTAKSFHREDETLLNFNRAGVPLIEIVSDPVMRSGKEAAKYVETIRDIAISLGISDAKMEEGSMRADVNISIRPFGTEEYGTRVEIKNLNSISNIEKAIKFEEELQAEQILKNVGVVQATKRFDESKKATVMMRSKSDAVDYKYFPEPNIPQVFIGKEFIDSIELPELPWERRKRYEDANVETVFIDGLISDIEKAKFFDLIQYDDKNKLAKVYFSEIIQIANSRKVDVKGLNIDPNEIVTALKRADEGVISGKHLKTIFPLLVDGKETVDQIIDSKGMKQLSDPVEIGKMVDTIIADNEKFISENADRPERVSKFVLGSLMKLSRGQANPVVANKIVNDKVGK